METKIITLRLNPEIEKIIQNILSRQYYLNRSVIINRILSAFLKCACAEDVDKIVTTYDAYDDGIIIKVSTLNAKWKPTKM